MNQQQFATGAKNTHLNRNVCPRLPTAHSTIRVNATTDRTSIPISRIFDHFRNMSTDNLEKNHMTSTDMLQNVTVQSRFRTDANTIVPTCLPVHGCKGLTTPPKEVRSRKGLRRLKMRRKQIKLKSYQNIRLLFF